MSDKVILSLQQLVKRYPGVLALGGVSFDLREGDVHAIVGENGAGKSTVIKCITGAIRPDSGSIVVDGESFPHMTPQLSESKGIAAIYQELTLFNYLSVAENMFFGREPMRGRFVDFRKMHRDAADIFQKIGVRLNTSTAVQELGIAYQQLVEIGKAVSHNSRILIMDEPSAALTTSEMESLYGVIRMLKAQGVSIIYISHRLEEIFNVCDRVTVLRDGKYIKTMDVKDTSRRELIRLMVGRDLTETYPLRNAPVGDIVLSARGLSNRKLKDVSFDLHRGEILGLGGLVGAGRTELARALFGADRLNSGTVTVLGKPLNAQSPKDAIAGGIGLVPEDRKQQGLLLDLSVRTNICFASMKAVSRGAFVLKAREAAAAKKYCKSLAIRTPNEEQIVKNLSGGNQQKVVLAKWMAVNSEIIVFDEPTRGIDVGAKAEIYELMNGMTKQGKSVIMISSDMPELIGMSDRIVVMRLGRVMGQVQGDEVTQERILDLASGN